MKHLVTVHDPLSAHRSTVYVDVEPDSPVRDVLPLLVGLTASDVTGATEGMAVDGRIVDPGASVRDCGFRSGSWITLLGPGGSPWPKVGFVPSTRQIRVVSGIGAGTICHSGPGVVTVGSAVEAGVWIADTGARDLELTLAIDDSGQVTVGVVPGGLLAPTLRGEPVVDGASLDIGDQIVFGRSIIEVADPNCEIAAVEANYDDGVLSYNRPPRILPPEDEPFFRLPTLPPEPFKAPLPFLTSMTPLLMAVTMALIFQNPRMLVFGLLSPVMLFSSYMSGRRSGAKKYKEQMVQYEERTTEVNADADEAVVTDRSRRLRGSPDPADLAQIAVVPTPRLWERRAVDPLWLSLRFGTATQDSAVSLEDPEELEHKRLKKWEVLNVPATVNLAEAGSLGIAGADSRARSLAQWAVAQIAVLHSPRDVQLYLLSGAAGADAERIIRSWEFLTWLPHVAPALGQDCLRTVGLNAQAVGERIAELLQVLDYRTKELGRSNEWAGSSLVVILDGSHRLRAMPGIVRLLREGPRAGIFMLCLDADERLLPEECETVVISTGDHVTFRRQRESDLVGIMPDWVSEDWLDWVARAIAPVIDTSPNESDSAIPTASRLLDVVSLDPPTPEAITARWVLNPRSTTAMIGESLDGAFSLDLVKHGPHGLIAGTTGSGKSELLQTIVAGLAVSNTPEGMTFVLVDYKGGAAFKDCVDLPHTVGMVTDLDTHLVGRALDSLGAELKWREHALAEAGAKDLEDYIDLSARRRDLQAIPRLLIVIDEFASLARELPNFVTGLVNIAQRGRSLGIHLILATQRPSGVVSPEIRANTNLRIALRVTDGSESSDVIDAPDAASIAQSTPGRAYVRLGSHSLVPFQAGRVGGRAPDYDAEAAGAAQSIDPLVRSLDFAELAGTAPVRQKLAASKGDVEVTDLKLLVSAIRHASERLDIPTMRKPWLPALEAEISLEDIEKGFGERRDPNRPAIWFGVQDFPKEQAQRPAAIDPDDYGHLYVVGGARSGKTTALRSIAVAAASAFSVEDVHLYGIDCGNGGLLPLAALPHVGTVVLRNQADQVSRLLSKLRTELLLRQAQLAAQSYSSMAEYRTANPDERPAQIFVLIDSWDGFLGALEDVEGGRLVETVQFLLREGASAGIHLVISGDRQLITGRMSMLAENKLVMRLVERSDYTAVGLNPRTLPEEIRDGQAFGSDGGTETQLAVPVAGLTGQEQGSWIRERGAELTAREAAVQRGSRPFNVEEMPAEITYKQAKDKYQVLESVPGDIFLGIGGQEVVPYVFNARSGSTTFVVAGPPKSGRSSALSAIAHSALASGYRLVIAAPKPSPLRELAGHSSVRAVITDPDALTEEALTPLLVGTGQPTLLIADDADLLRDIEADRFLRGVATNGADLGVGIIIAGDVTSLGKGFSGWIVETRKARQGLLFKPQTLTEGDVIGAKLKRSDIGTEMPAGRGYLQADDGTLQIIQVPLVPVPGEGIEVPA